MIRLRVQEILEERNLSKDWLWMNTGMSYRNFDRMLKNETIAIRYKNIEKLCEILDCSPGDLFEFVPEEYY